MNITYITTCKGRLNHLKQTLPGVVRQRGIDIVVVDYGCPDGTADWVGQVFPAVRVVRVDDDPGFNTARARNRAAAVSSTQWLAFFDADILLGDHFFAHEFPRLATGNFYVADPADPNTSGSCIVERAAFEAVGGYDEVFSGWGGEDIDLYNMLALHGVRRGTYSGQMVTPIRHTDLERTRFHAIKDLNCQLQLNDFYRQVKMDLLRMTGSIPDRAQRAELWGAVTRLIARAAENDLEPADRTLRVSLPDRALKSMSMSTSAAASNPQIRSWLSYELSGRTGLP